ncbi:Os05g0547301 [Oryza sativa Japonica Group]|uniref:Os05g0547301 protein n=1 Tax=Oryza sativa subsp. japonica TaxID=39947 RepID=A0A0P0WQN0_ORYSJ|nr:Os05g0547301 [Oryza sativa Japonica Group]
MNKINSCGGDQWHESFYSATHARLEVARHGVAGDAADAGLEEVFLQPRRDLREATVPHHHPHLLTAAAAAFLSRDRSTAPQPRRQQDDHPQQRLPPPARAVAVARWRVRRQAGRWTIPAGGPWSNIGSGSPISKRVSADAAWVTDRRYAIVGVGEGGG